MTGGRGLNVRQATAGDRIPLQKVLLDAYGEYEAVLPGQRWEEYKASILQAVDEGSLSVKLVAERDGAAIGSVFLFDSSEAAYGLPDLNIQSPIIRLLAVIREARGTGAATELIRESARLARARGAEWLYLHTSDMMGSAVRLYERLGFERAHDKEFMNGDLLVKCYRLDLVRTPLLA